VRKDHQKPPVSTPYLFKSLFGADYFPGAFGKVRGKITRKPPVSTPYLFKSLFGADYFPGAFGKVRGKNPHE
jgi:hypothetical protein